jgi:thiamine-monophosphate kinase
VLAGIGDDAAVVAPERNACDVITTDALVEGVHFDRRITTAADVGFKALAVNLSDLAAMGAAPRLAVLSLGLPAAMEVADVDALVEALVELATQARAVLVGGNITRSPLGLFVDVTAVGTVGRRRFLTRAGARTGDELYVTGTFGAAAAGLAWLRSALDDGAIGVEDPDDPDLADCVRRYRRPDARTRLGLLLGRNRAASACMDASDGLADAVHQIAAASGVGAVVEGASVPVHPGARRWFDRRGVDSLDAAIRGGEDYELVFTVSKKTRSRFGSVRRLAGPVPITRIGTMTAGRDVVLKRGEATGPLPHGFVHF